MILVEEFMSCLPDNVKTYIEEQKADNLQQAATLADDYSLTHRSSFIALSSIRGSVPQDDPSSRNSHSGTPTKPSQLVMQQTVRDHISLEVALEGPYVTIVNVAVM